MGIINVYELLYPPVCALCNGAGKNGLDLCNGCYTDLPHRMDSVCKEQSWQYVDRCLAPLHYGNTAAYLIKGLKFNQQLAYGQILGNILAACLLKEFNEMQLQMPQCIIPVPLHPTRLKSRGFNQSQEITQVAAKMLPLPIENRVCVRVLKTKPQTELTRKQRLQNLRGAFAVIGKAPTCVAIVDDVITTGATINELAQTLKNAGVQYIHAWAVARTGD